MNKFLEIVYESQSNSVLDDSYKKSFSPLLDRLQTLLSESLYNEIEEITHYCAMEYGYFHATQGMELAIGIMDGTYVPKI